MDDLELLRIYINRDAFSRKGTRLLNAILDKAIERGHLLPDEKKAMKIVMDYEQKIAAIDAKALEEEFTLTQDFYDKVIKKIQTDLSE